MKKSISRFITSEPVLAGLLTSLFSMLITLMLYLIGWQVFPDPNNYSRAVWGASMGGVSAICGIIAMHLLKRSCQLRSKS